MTEVTHSVISGQSMQKSLPIWFSNWSFSSLQSHWIGGDRHNNALVLFVGLKKFSALLVQWNRSSITVRGTVNPEISSHSSNFATVVMSAHLWQASTCPEKVSKMTRTHSKLEHSGIGIRSTRNFTSGPCGLVMLLHSAAAYIVLLKRCPNNMKIQG